MLKPYEKYNPVESKWIDTIPSTWGYKKVKELFIERKERNNPIKTHEILALTAKQGVIPYSQKESSGGNKTKEDLTQYNLAHPNDLLINCMNIVSGAAGVSRYYGAISPVYYALSQRDDSINIWYYHTIFRFMPFQRSLLGLGKGILMHESSSGALNTVRMRIPMSNLNNVMLPVPSREEQDKIVRFLDWKLAKINKFIKAKKKLIAVLKEQKQAIINQAVTKGIDSNVKMKPSGIEWLGDVPEHWEICKLKKYAKINPSINRIRNKYSLDDKVAFLAMESISVDGKINNSEYRKIKDVKTGFTSFQRSDTVIAKITPCFENGKGACLDSLETEIGYGTTELIVLRSDEDDLLSKYLYYITRSGYFRILGSEVMTGSAGQKRVPVSFVSNFIIGIPHVDEQKYIIEFIDRSHEKISNSIQKVEQELNLILEYKNSLISDVVTGKIDVRRITIDEIEQMVISESEFDEESTDEEMLDTEGGE